MRALVQRVTRASVTVGGEVTGAIDAGLLVLLGVSRSDDAAAADKLADKVARLRVFGGEGGRMDRSLVDLGAGGAALCVSQFTLYGDVRRGLRPSFTEAAAPDVAEALYERFCAALKERGVRVETGRFAADMDVELVNRGPVTLLVEV